MMKAIKHYLQFNDLTFDEYLYLFARASAMKSSLRTEEIGSAAYEARQTLRGRLLAMIFAKNSTRTRLSFEAGIIQLGGHAVFLSAEQTQLSRGETFEDSARVVSGMADIVVIRTFEQRILDRFAAHSRVPVINGLTNEYHPCQVMADIFTFQELRGSIEGKVVAWIGDANNMTYTWLQAARLFGFSLQVSTPPQHALEPHRIADGERRHLTVFDNPRDACRNADIISTDVWTSMGCDAESGAREAAFAGWRVTTDLLRLARPDALFMHCLPAHRGEEVDADVIDGAQSVVWAEAENRLHVQKALLEYLLRGKVAA